MGTTKELLLKQMSRLELNYGKDKFKVDQDIFDLWYEMFADCNEEGFKQAIDRCIKENEFAPNIAGVMKYYKEIKDEHDEIVDTIKSQYRNMCALWPEEYDKETFDAIVDYICRFPKKTRKVEMIELSQRAISFSFDCEGCGRKDKPTIKEYVEGAR